MRKEIRKSLLLIMLLFCLCPFSGFASDIVCDSIDDMDKIENSCLRVAFENISKLENFQQISREDTDFDDLLAEKFGGVAVGVVCGNSHQREEVISFLSVIPEENLYSEYRNSYGKFVRCYLLTMPSGQTQMMYTIVGNGGNDLVVALFADGPMEKYLEYGEEIKQMNTSWPSSLKNK